MEHQLGKCDFKIVEQEFPVTVFRRKISSVRDYAVIPGHVAAITYRGKRQCCLLSIETYACMAESYEKTMQKINAMADQYREQRREKSGKEVSA